MTDHVPDLASLFANHTIEAFRLEILPQYHVAGEWDNFQEYLTSGKLIADPDLVDYLRAAALKMRDGVKHIRARVVDTPLNDYQRFEIGIGYIPSAALGTEFFFMERANFETMLRNEFGGNFPAQDFWLFDKKDLAVMHYDEQGRFTGFEIVTNPKVIQACLILRQCMMIDGYDLDTLLDAHPDL